MGRTTAVQQVCEAEEQECQVKGEEQCEEGDSRAESANEQQEGEDEPAHEVQSERVEAISNPPGVRMMAVPIQKPPYEDRAVAPKVLPRAISLCFVSLIVSTRI